MLQPAPHPRKTVPRRSSASQTHAAFAFPAPQLGINTAAPMPGGNPLTALRLENLIPRSLGCVLRPGYLRWVSNLDGEVRSLMSYQPLVGDPKLLAATSTGKIYDVTLPQASGVVPVPIATVVGGQPDGEWTSLNFTTDGDVHVMLAVNPGAGLWKYDGVNFTQIVAGVGPGEISGVDPKSFAHMTVYKRRLWFTQLETATAWYMPTGLFAGAATPFHLGAMLPSGGRLAVCINWTFDGGGGAATGGASLGNKIVFVSDQGDVLVYNGQDADIFGDFQVEGRWFIGKVPVGRRFYTQYLSDVIFLSERGMCFLSELMRGQGFFQNVSNAQAVNSELATQISTSLVTRYWEIVFLPQVQLLVINRSETNLENLQWCYEVNNKAFATLRGIPMLTVAPFNTRSFCGDIDGNVWWIFQGDSDGAIDNIPGKSLQGVCVTAFQTMGEAIRLKRFLMVRPSFISKAPPGVQAVLNSEWHLAAPSTAPPYIASGDSLWDSAQWDAAVWSGEGQSYESWVGASGTGRYASLALRVRGPADTIFVGWQALVESGGIL